MAEKYWEPWKCCGYPTYVRFIRSPLIGGNVNVAVVEPLTDPLPIAREINRIGVNVNQITRWANENQHSSRAEVYELEESFVRIEALLGQLFEDRREAQERAMKKD
nr:MobC family plasmid mobilization relaxosome protein [Bifidobacterium catenulatum]